jgi:hypothetical protein
MDDIGHIFPPLYASIYKKTAVYGNGSKYAAEMGQTQKQTKAVRKIAGLVCQWLKSKQGRLSYRAMPKPQPKALIQS